MSNHDCTEYAQEILSLVREGCPTGFNGPDENIISDNWPSCEKYSNGVSLYMDKHRNTGAIVGPIFEVSRRFRCSPLGAFEKQKGKIRIIHDLSWPPGRAVNDYIKKEDYSVQYTTVSEAVRRCTFYNGAWLSKTDLSDAYLQCPLKTEDSDLLGFQWYSEEGRLCFFKCVTLVLGLRSAPYFFEKISTALEYTAKLNGACRDTSHFLADFLIFSITSKECREGLDMEIHCALQCGLK